MNTSASHELPALTVRRLSVDLSRGFSRHWNGGDVFRTAFCNALSMSFPVGEQFFMDAVREGSRRLPDTLENQDIKATVRDFIGQEATHRHLHSLYNTHLEKQGLLNRWGPRAAWRLQIGRQRMFSQSEKGYLHELALTAAYEHFTAIFGEITLDRADMPGDVLAGAEEPLKTLWRWHAAEESEHKSVAFELYTRLGGNYRWRMRWFAYVMVQFTVDATLQTLSNLRHDGQLLRPGTWWSAARFLLGRHGLLWRVTPPLLTYWRRDFHPDKVGNPKLSSLWFERHATQWSPVKSSSNTVKPLPP